MMMRRFLFLLLAFFTLLSEAQQLFKQDFEISSQLKDYRATIPGIGEFGRISPTATNLETTVDGVLQFNRTGSSRIFAVRNFDLSETPNLVELKLDFELVDYRSSGENTIFDITVGNGFIPSPVSISPADRNKIVSRIRIVGVNNANEFKINSVDNIGGGVATTGVFSGKQTLTFIINKTGSSQTYNSPNNTSETLANGKMDLWVGGSKVFSGGSLRNAGEAIAGFKIESTSTTVLGTYAFDNVEFTDLLGESVFAHSGDNQVLTHPRVWVKPSDRQGILDNISTHSWAKNMYDNLVARYNPRLISHPINPSTDIVKIPGLPGDRNTHREQLNVGVECGILYYLTEDERYARIAADILHQYVKIISVEDPLTFDFAENTTHLIESRELLPRVGVLYDFVYNYVSKSGITVFDIDTNSQVEFNLETAEKALDVLAEYALRLGADQGDNHPVLEAPGPLYNIIAMNDSKRRDIYFDLFINGGGSLAGFNEWVLPNFTSQGLWPESVGYARGTQAIALQTMNVIDKYAPELNIIENNKEILESLFFYEDIMYPSSIASVAYGDLPRTGTYRTIAYGYRAVLEMADRKGYVDLREKAATTLQRIYEEEGGYNPIIEDDALEWDSPLQLLWGIDVDQYGNLANFTPSTTLNIEFSGTTVQRNYSGVDDEQNGLMYYNHGGTYVHGHSGGIDMELYGAGYVIGPDYGFDSYGTEINSTYVYTYAAHNTIIVNESSGRGPRLVPGTVWQNITDPVEFVAQEPEVDTAPISDNFCFSTKFLDDNINNVDQQRTNGIIRTSPTSGYYIDVFRSITNENETTDKHDYIFHGLGDVMQLSSNGSPLVLTGTPDRYQSSFDIDVFLNIPGWNWFRNINTSTATTNGVSGRFHIQFDNKFLHVQVPDGVEREYTSALSLPTQDVRNGYNTKDTQVFVMRKYGEAWNEPFIALYEPSSNAESTIVSTKHLYNNSNKVIGVEVISNVNGQDIRDVIIANDTDQETIVLRDYDLEFTGRYAILRTEPKESTTDVSLYIGDGQELKFLDDTLVANASNEGYLETTLDFSYTGPNPSNLFRVQTVSEKCVDSDNGEINIEAIREGSYVATLNEVNYDFTTTTSIENLAPGNYNLCVKKSDNSFEQCYDLVVEEALPFNAKIDIDKQNAQVTVASGSAPYTVIKNGVELFRTRQSNFSVAVKDGDVIQVQGKEACQGEMSKTINLFEDIKAYPNPSKGLFELFVPESLNSLQVELYDIRSRLLSSKEYSVEGGRVQVDLQDKPNGVYFVKVNAVQPKFIKVIKQ